MTQQIKTRLSKRRRKIEKHKTQKQIQKYKNKSTINKVRQEHKVLIDVWISTQTFQPL